MQVEGTESRGNIQFIRSNESQIALTLGLVLHHLPFEVRSTIQKSIEFAVQETNLRFAGLFACDRSVSKQALTALLHSDADFSRCHQTMDTLGVRAAAYIQEYPGKLACMVGPASILNDLDQSNIVVELVKKLVDIGWEWSVELVQVLLESDAPYSRSALKMGGFNKISNLIQMQLDQPFPFLVEANEPEFRLGDEPLQWRRYQEADRMLWLDWLDQTYRETRDCPELNGIRSTQSSMDGYLAASRLPGTLKAENEPMEPKIAQEAQAKPATKGMDQRGELEGAENSISRELPHWWGGFVEVDRKPALVAAYLLSPTVPGVYELTYMGVAPAARQKKLGQSLLRRAIKNVQQLGGDRLWLAVDERNSVARTLYEQFGFQEIRRLEAWIAVPPGKSLAE